MDLVGGGLARNLDEMYFTHAMIYQHRSRPWPMQEANMIMSRPTFEHQLPAAIFQCGVERQPPEVTNRSELVKELDLLIRAKLILEPIPSSLKSYVEKTISGGILSIRYEHYYEVFLTLQHLDAYADWNIIGKLIG